MSQENVEIVRRVFEAAASGDSAAVFALYDPAVEWDASRAPMPRLIGGGGVFHGHDGLRRFFQERNAIWGEIDDVPKELGLETSWKQRTAADPCSSYPLLPNSG